MHENLRVGRKSNLEQGKTGARDGGSPEYRNIIDNLKCLSQRYVKRITKLLVTLLIYY